MFHSNRIKIQEILLILQLETDYFSKLFISESAPFEAVALQSSQRLPELLFYTKKPYRILQAPIPAPILHVHITLQSREFSIQNPILHTEDKELFEYYYYIPEGKETFSPVSRNSTHRRQGDLLEMHPCVLQDLPMTFQAFQSFMTFQPFQAILQVLQISVSPGNPPHSSILRLECIFYNSYSSIGFHRNSTEYQLNSYKHSFFKEREMLRYRSN